MKIYSPEKIRKRRLKLKITQQSLARDAKISREHLAALEAGKSIPRVSTLLAIADVLKCRVGYFFVDGVR